jgi:hypothetical protein
VAGEERQPRLRVPRAPGPRGQRRDGKAEAEEREEENPAEHGAEPADLEGARAAHVHVGLDHAAQLAARAEDGHRGAPDVGGLPRGRAVPAQAAAGAVAQPQADDAVRISEIVGGLPQAALRIEEPEADHVADLQGRRQELPLLTRRCFARQDRVEIVHVAADRLRPGGDRGLDVRAQQTLRGEEDDAGRGGHDQEADRERSDPLRPSRRRGSGSSTHDSQSSRTTPLAQCRGGCEARLALGLSERSGGMRDAPARQRSRRPGRARKREGPARHHPHGQIGEGLRLDGVAVEPERFGRLRARSIGGEMF